jgi:hypothetical protein
MKLKSVFLGFGAGIALVLAPVFSESANAFLIFDNNPLDANVVDNFNFNQATNTTLVNETFGDTSSEFRKTLFVTPADLLAQQTLTFRITNGLSAAIAGYKFSFFNGQGNPVANLSPITSVSGGPFSSLSITNNAVSIALANAVGTGDNFDVSFSVNTSDLRAFQQFDILQEAQVVPTPALLPGLIGMGIAALRRKDKESAEEKNA